MNLRIKGSGSPEFPCSKLTIGWTGGTALVRTIAASLPPGQGLPVAALSALRFQIYDHLGYRCAAAAPNPQSCDVKGSVTTIPGRAPGQTPPASIEASSHLDGKIHLNGVGPGWPGISLPRPFG